MEVHTIRLRAPWKWERKSDICVWSRVFGCPTNLTEHETVRLVLRSESARASVTLNRVALGEAPASFDVTRMLRARNKVVLSMDQLAEVETGGREPPFEVTLEVVSDSPS